PKPKSGIRISTLFWILIILGSGSTAYGLYEIYQLFTTFPPELRADLRAGLKAKHDTNYRLSAKHFQKRAPAYDAALALDIDKFGTNPYLKISGIAVALGEVLEKAQLAPAAFDAYKRAYELLRDHRVVLSGPERLRGVAIAHKLGDLADAFSLGDAEEESWRVTAVEDALRVARATDKHAPKPNGVQGASSEDENARVVLAELELPRWLTTADIGAPIEALGEFYARTGRVDYALPLYLQAISLLIPPEDSGKKGTLEDVCRGAQMMNNLSELILRGKLTPEKIHQAEAWARKALEVIDKTKAGASYLSGVSMCEQATAVTLFNLATIREMDKDTNSAKELFQAAFDKSMQIGLRDGAMRAKLALQRIARTERGATLVPPRADTPPTKPE
ncbi:hypothetical protein K488DRAFT_57122, partial [Vararia minispora EC-137]